MSTRKLLLVVGIAFALGLVVMRVATSHRPPRALTLKIGAPPVDSYIERSKSAIEAKDYAGAMAIAEQGLLLQPANVQLRMNVGVARLLRGEIARGRAVLQAVARDLPDDELAQNNLAWADQLAAQRVTALWAVANQQSRAMDHAAAMATWDQIRVLAPTNASALNNLGVELMALGKYAVAKQWFQAAAKLGPDEVYRNNIAWADRELAKQTP